MPGRTVLVAKDFERATGNKFALRVRGNSMSEDDIHDGDLIVFTKSSKAKNGDAVIALIDGQRAVIRKFHRMNDRIRLMSIGEQHKPTSISGDKIEILGKVIGIQREA